MVYIEGYEQPDCVILLRFQIVLVQPSSLEPVARQVHTLVVYNDDFNTIIFVIIEENCTELVVHMPLTEIVFIKSILKSIVERI